jgi:hypothetical protein
MSPSILAAAVFAGPDAFWFTAVPRVGFLNPGERTGLAPWLVRIDPRTDIRAAVRRAKAWSASGIAVYSHLTGRQVRSIADAARRERLPVWSHAPVGPASPLDLVEARVSTIAHADALVRPGGAGVLPGPAGAPGATIDTYDAVLPDDPVIRDLLGRMRERNIALEPTLYIGLQTAAFATADRPQIDRRLAWAAAVTERARQLGVSVVTGTDAIGGSSPNLHVELQLLVTRAGFSPLQAIRSATFDAARALGLADTEGSVAAGRRADLEVLVRDPVEDIRNTQTILMVLRGGVVHELIDPMPTPPLAEAPRR